METNSKNQMPQEAQASQESQTPGALVDDDFYDLPDDTVFEEADGAIAGLAAEFIARLPDELLKIEEALTELEAAPSDKDCYSNLFSLVHDLKGMAGTFDYMLLTVIGDALCHFLERPEPLTVRSFKVVRFHVEAMKLVVQKSMSGTDNSQGQRLVDTLHSMTQKVLGEG